MTREECIDGLRKIVESDKNKILVRVHVGFLIHAIKFMEEQEQIKPIRHENWWECPSCGKNIFANMKYCYGCGKKLKWDGYAERR